jgi:hypothetical protein
VREKTTERDSERVNGRRREKKEKKKKKKERELGRGSGGFYELAGGGD